jgi:hypothetical protein
MRNRLLLAVAVALAATPSVAVAFNEGGAAPGAATPAGTAVPAQAADPETAAPFAPRRSVDTPVPRQDDERPEVPSNAEPLGRRPGSGLSFFTGFGLGGAEFVKATNSKGGEETLSAGSGLIFGLGGMVTPLWPSQHLGLGLGLDGAIKYDSIDAQNGSASITRYPIALTAHLLTNGSGGPHYFMLKGGVIRDFGVNYSLSGLAMIDANVTGTWGPTGALGYYKKFNDSFAWDLMGFFALTKHVIGTERFSANSFGLTLGLHLNL